MQKIMFWMVLVLAGCATSPQEVIERGTRFTGEIKGTPLEAANCIAKNAEQQYSHLASVRADGTEQELIVRSSAAAYFTLAVWRFQPQGTSSKYEARISDAYLPSHEVLMQKMKGAC
jgi:hypothetical protein